MRAKAVAAIIMLLFLSSLLMAGTFAAAFAIDVALTPSLGTAGAAGLTAFILLILPLGWAIISLIRRPPPSHLLSETAIATVLASLAKEMPVIALVGAALIGAAGAFFKRKKN